MWWAQAEMDKLKGVTAAQEAQRAQQLQVRVYFSHKGQGPQLSCRCPVSLYCRKCLHMSTCLCCDPNQPCAAQC